jgi:polyhydroxyalkanoate synthesis regulator phasin
MQEVNDYVTKIKNITSDEITLRRAAALHESWSDSQKKITLYHYQLANKQLLLMNLRHVLEENTIALNQNTISPIDAGKAAAQEIELSEVLSSIRLIEAAERKKSVDCEFSVNKTNILLNEHKHFVNELIESLRKKSEQDNNSIASTFTFQLALFFKKYNMLLEQKKTYFNRQLKWIKMSDDYQISSFIDEYFANGLSVKVPNIEKTIFRKDAADCFQSVISEIYNDLLDKNNKLSLFASALAEDEHYLFRLQDLMESFINSGKFSEQTYTNFLIELKRKQEKPISTLHTIMEALPRQNNVSSSFEAVSQYFEQRCFHLEQNEHFVKTLATGLNGFLKNAEKLYLELRYLNKEYLVTYKKQLIKKPVNDAGNDYSTKTA